MGIMHATLFYDNKLMEEKYLNKLIDSFNKIQKEYLSDDWPKDKESTFLFGKECSEVEKYLGIKTGWFDYCGCEIMEAEYIYSLTYENKIEICLSTCFNAENNGVIWLREISKKYRCDYAFLDQDDYDTCEKWDHGNEKFYPQKYFIKPVSNDEADFSLFKEPTDLYFFNSEQEAIEGCKELCPNAKSIDDINTYFSENGGNFIICEIADYCA